MLSFRETAGCGIEGLVQGREILLGSRGWLESRGVTVPPSEGGSVAARGLEACAISASTVHAAIGGRYRGVFTLSNPVRPEIDRLLRELGRRYEIALLSGDTEKERERFRNLFAGDSRLRFNQSPLDKLGFIRRLQQSGKTVMMVGDGLNDAGALKQSDVGVAVVEETGAFSPASDVILEGGQVPCLFETLTLARRAALIVRLSFGISALYNLAGIGIAAAGMLSPLICAILMPLSSISVVGFACAATNGAARNLGLGRKASPPAATAAAAPEWQPAF